MTFGELNTKLGGNEVAANWSQHSNGGGWINKTAKVDATAYVGPEAIVWGAVYGNAQVYGNAWVYGDAWVYGNAQVYGNAWEKSPLFIIGSKYSLTNAKKGYIQIGCKCETFKWWTSKEALAFAKANGFTAADIKEYRAYIELFKKVGK